MEVKDGSHSVEAIQGRRLTPQEKQRMHQLFPRMNLDAVVVSGEADARYNCLSWTLGITTTWVWPWGSRNATLAEFDGLYRGHGYDPSRTGTIAAFGFNNTSMTHGSITGPGHGPRWESKLGAWLRIQHGLGEMEGGPLYGNVLRYYAHRRAQEEFGERREFEAADILKEYRLTDEEIREVQQLLAPVDDAVKERFAERYQRWVATWEHPFIALSSNPHARAESLEFAELIALGTEIVPLLMEKLTHPEEFFALQAVDRLWQPASLYDREPLTEEAILGGEQLRASETVRQWLAFNR